MIAYVACLDGEDKVLLMEGPGGLQLPHAEIRGSELEAAIMAVTLATGRAIRRAYLDRVGARRGWCLFTTSARVGTPEGAHWFPLDRLYRYKLEPGTAEALRMLGA